METNSILQDKNWKEPIEAEQGDIFSEIYQMELRVIIPDHGLYMDNNDVLKDYCLTYAQTEICNL